MSFYPLNWKLANRIRSTSAKRSLYHGHVAVQDVAPLNAAVASVHAAIPLTSAAAGQDIAAGWVAGAQAALALCPQPLEIKGVGAGVTGNVVITGTDICGNAITDTIAASGTSTVAGIKAFASVSNVHVPVQSTTGETISVGTTKAFGVPFLANPDLPTRYQAGAALNAPDPATFYGGAEQGYTDYPFMEPA